MIAFLDVQYGADHATAGCVLAAAWTDDRSAAERVAGAAIEAEYLPGELYRRELPPILAVLDGLDLPLDVIVVDGYAWLGPERPGLGVHLHRALGGRVPVVGVAKNSFAARGRFAAAGSAGRPEGGEPLGSGAPPRAIARVAPELAGAAALPVVRGASAKPLWVTAIGMDPAEAAAHVAAMHGEHRIPTLLLRADHLARGLP